MKLKTWFLIALMLYQTLAAGIVAAAAPDDHHFAGTYVLVGVNETGQLLSALDEHGHDHAPGSLFDHEHNDHDSHRHCLPLPHLANFASELNMALNLRTDVPQTMPQARLSDLSFAPPVPPLDA